MKLSIHERAWVDEAALVAFEHYLAKAGTIDARQPDELSDMVWAQVRSLFRARGRFLRQLESSSGRSHRNTSVVESSLGVSDDEGRSPARNGEPLPKVYRSSKNNFEQTRR